LTRAENRLASKLLALLAAILVLSPLASFAATATTAKYNGPGMPSALVVTSLPPTLPADNKSYRSIVVSLEDINFRPSLALSPIRVNLRSSELNVGIVNLTVTIPIGQDYVIATMTTTNIPGATEITASTPNLLPGFATVTTVTPSGLASALRVFSVPDKVFPNTRGVIVVELLDDTGLPAKSATGVTVSLESTNPSVVLYDQSTLTIRPGQFYTTVGYTAGPDAGSTATVSAFSPGYAAGQGQISVVNPGSAPFEVYIRGLFSTNNKKAMIMPADGQVYSALEVSLVDNTGVPVPAPPSGVAVQLSSSKNTVIGVNGTVVIPGGQSWTVTQLQTGILQGSSNVTAFAQGYLGSSTDISAVIPAPSRLALYVDPNVKITTGTTEPLLVVQLQDSNGVPARAKAPTSVLVTAANASVTQGSLTLNITKGEDFVSTFLRTKETGSTVLTASSSGLVTARNIPMSVIAFPVSLVLKPAASFILINQTDQITLTLQFLGAPRQGSNVTWYASGGSIVPSNSNTSSAGTAVAVFTPAAAGLGNVTVVVNDPAIKAQKASAFIIVSLLPVRPPLTPLQLIIRYSFLLLIPIAAVAAYLVIYFRRRRKKAREELEAAFQNVT
jgi:hypothetical protein